MFRVVHVVLDVDIVVSMVVVDVVACMLICMLCWLCACMIFRWDSYIFPHDGCYR